MKLLQFITAMFCMATALTYAQSNYPFNGLDMNMGTLSKLSDAKNPFHKP